MKHSFALQYVRAPPRSLSGCAVHRRCRTERADRVARFLLGYLNGSETDNVCSSALCSCRITDTYIDKYVVYSDKE